MSRSWGYIVIQGRTIFLGAGFVAMSLTASVVRLRREGKGTAPCAERRKLSFLEPLDVQVDTELIFAVTSDGGIRFRGSEGAQLVCGADRVLTPEAPELQDGDVLSSVKGRCMLEVVGLQERYRVLATVSDAGASVAERGPGRVCGTATCARAEGERRTLSPASCHAGRCDTAGGVCGCIMEGMGSSGD